MKSPLKQKKQIHFPQFPHSTQKYWGYVCVLFPLSESFLTQKEHIHDAQYPPSTQKYWGYVCVLFPLSESFLTWCSYPAYN